MNRLSPIFLLACAAPPPSADAVDVAGDPRLAALPAESTVIASVDLPDLAAGVGAATLLRDAGVDVEPLRALAEAGVGVSGFRARDARLGCAESGCIVLLEGNFSADGVEGLAGAVAARMPVTEGGGELPGFDVAMPDGSAWVLRALAEDKAVFGEREAVREVWEAQRSGAAGFDAASLAGRVPRGEAWMLMRDPARVEAAAARRAERASGAEGAARVHAAFARLREQVPALDRVDTLALTVGATGEVHLRAWVPAEVDATDVELRARAATATAPALSGGTVTRVGPQVDVTARPGADTLQRLLAGPR